MAGIDIPYFRNGVVTSTTPSTKMYTAHMPYVGGMTPFECARFTFVVAATSLDNAKYALEVELQASRMVDFHDGYTPDQPTLRELIEEDGGMRKFLDKTLMWTIHELGAVVYTSNRVD